MLTLFIYSFVITFFIKKNINSTSNYNCKEILKNFFKLFIVDFITFIIISIMLEKYDYSMVNLSKEICFKSGEWDKTCYIDDNIALTNLLSIFMIFVAHHFFSIKYVYKIIKNSKKVFPYIFMYIRMILLSVATFFVLLYLYGLFTTYKYMYTITDIIRFITTSSLLTLYIVSTIIYKIKKNKA